MLTRCHHWDLGRSLPPAQQLTERLQEISHREAILVSSQTSFPPDWEQSYSHLLINGPSMFMRVYWSLYA
ncbi:MAG: hypothetical protein KIS61_16995 [Candidatus Eremiobacteraeota bacterium]|nr:hypothetical protein [Candidatus Eremiobacteraeota bacterium]